MGKIIAASHSTRVSQRQTMSRLIIKRVVGLVFRNYSWRWARTPQTLFSSQISKVHKNDKITIHSNVQNFHLNLNTLRRLSGVLRCRLKIADDSQGQHDIKCRDQILRKKNHKLVSLESGIYCFYTETWAIRYNSPPSKLWQNVFLEVFLVSAKKISW